MTLAMLAFAAANSTAGHGAQAAYADRDAAGRKSIRATRLLTGVQLLSEPVKIR